MVMQVNKPQSLKGYWVSIVLAMGLNIVSFSEIFKSLNPDWVLLTLIYWVIAIPERIGVFNAWGVGLLVDVLTGRVLGEHALTYALISYFCVIFHKRLRQYLLLQQSLFIFLSLLFSQIVEIVIESIESNTQFTFTFWLPVITGVLLWPVVSIVLRTFSYNGRLR